MSRYTGTFPTRGAYENSLADRYRAELFTLLGPECGLCGADLRTQVWELNHLFRREWKPSKVGRYQRNKRYLREAGEGLCNLLCKPCNLLYRARQDPPKAGVASVEDPF